MLQKINGDVILLVKVIPKASKSSIVAWEGDRLKIRIAAVPEKGAANAELINFLAKYLDIAKSRLCLMQGETSRLKTVAISHMSLEEVEGKLRGGKNESG